tara:strand:- start:2561 stop:3700 length:1140 start_codon:yes stop_codon:yes gene_type:complete
VDLNDATGRAECNDGTPPKYEWRQAAAAASRDIWVVILQSGGWAYDQAGYTARNPLYKGSTSWSSGTHKGIFHAADVTLRHANLVYLRYCSSDAFMADTDVDFGDGIHIPFRGYAILKALLVELVVKRGMGARSGTKLVFGGQSAGSRGAMMHLDYLPSMLAEIRRSEGRSADIVANTQIYGFLDSPMHLDMPGYYPTPSSDSNPHPMANITRQFYNRVSRERVGTDGHLDADCIAANSGDEWRCMMGHYRVAYLKTPTLVMAALDDWYVRSIMYDRPWADERYRTAWDPPGLYNSSFRKYAEKTRQLLQEAPANVSVVALSCNMHAGSYYYYDFNEIGAGGVSGQTPNTALAKLMEGQHFKWIDNCTGFACSGQCAAP